MTGDDKGDRSGAAKATRAHIPASGKKRGWPSRIKTHGDEETQAIVTANEH